MSGARATVDAEDAGRKVEEVLDRLAASGDRAACDAAEELVRVLLEFYGAGLGRVLELLGRDPGAPAREALEGLLGDRLVASLLVLHGLHPEDTDARIARALGELPYPLERDGFDPATGELRLCMTGSAGCGCGSSQEAVEQAATEAMACFVPEVTAVGITTVREPALLQIGTRPPGAGAPTGRPPATPAP